MALTFCCNRQCNQRHLFHLTSRMLCPLHFLQTKCISSSLHLCDQGERLLYHSGKMYLLHILYTRLLTDLIKAMVNTQDITKGQSICHNYNFKPVNSNQQRICSSYFLKTIPFLKHVTSMSP